MENLYFKLLKEIGENPDREGLKSTPKRAWEAFQYLTKGYNEDLKEIIGTGIFESDTNDMVLVKNNDIYSMCEHHLLPFTGVCHVAYIPNGKIIGISKIPRIIDHFARRLQTQERLTRQIAETIEKYTNALGVAVVIEAKHLCMIMRGVEKHNSVMTTSSVLGEFHEEASTRAEFFSLIKD